MSSGICLVWQYQFNDSGNVVAMRDELGYGQFAKFEAGVDNKPSEVSSCARSSSTSCARSTSPASGRAAVRSQGFFHALSGHALSEADCLYQRGSYYQQSVTLLPNQTYTFSAYVKTEDVQGGIGAFLRLASADGWTQADSEPVTGSTPAAMAMKCPRTAGRASS